MTKVTEDILVELEFTATENAWIHSKGTKIYKDKCPEKLNDLVNILTGTAFRKGELKSKKQ